MRISVLLVMAMVIVGMYATHYRGGTFYYERLGKKKIRMYWRLAFTLDTSWREFFCENPGDMKTDTEYTKLTCTDCGKNNTILKPLTMECAIISPDAGWSFLDGYVDYEADREKFTVAYKEIDSCRDTSWIGLQNYGHGKCYSLLTKVDTTKNNDSPRVTAALPVYRVRHGCKSLIDLNPTDINGDPIKCRWAADPSECPSQRDGNDDKPVCGKPTKEIIIYEEECKIEFITGQDELPGWYGASVMIEDFPDTRYKKAKSTVPFQFLLQVTEPGSCVGPRVDIEECSIIEPGEKWISYVTATIVEGSDANTITGIQGSYPNGMKMSYVGGSEPSQRTVKAKLEFTTEKEDTYAFTFTATDNNGVQNNPMSGRLVVTNEPFVTQGKKHPVIVAGESTPAINTLYEGTSQFWTLKFDLPVIRPDKDSFIRIRDIKIGNIYAEYNAMNEDEVIFSEDDPTIVKYRAPTDLEGGKTYLVNVDDGFGVRKYKDPCGKITIDYGLSAVYNFKLPKPPKPEVECGDSYIKVTIPKVYVNNIPASALHLHDSKCRIKEVNANQYQIEFGYDECGTIIKRSSKSKTKFFNTVRDDPKPIFPGAPVTRARRKIEMQIICEMRGVGVNDVFFKPNAAVNPEKYKTSGEFKTYLQMYEDESYSNAIRGTASVELKERLYFRAQSTSSKDVAIESCRAMAKFATCTADDKKYTFIENGCGVDSSVSLTSVGLDHRFSIKSFGFLQYGLTNEVFVKCRMVSCMANNNSSRCAELKSGNCSSRGRQSTAAEEEEFDTFITFSM